MAKDAILVTGGSGFLGKEICHQLKGFGYEVVDISIDPEPRDGITTIRADISHFEPLEDIFRTQKFSTILHLAALLTTRSNQYPDQAFKTNILGSYNLMELARRFEVKRFVYASSFSAIGHGHTEEIPADESILPTPDNFYGETKRFVEKLGLSYAQKYHLPFIAGRLGVLVGAGKPIASSAWRMDIFNMLKTGGTIETKFKPNVILAFSEVKETAQAFATLVKAEKPQHAIYHLPHDSMTMEQLTDILQGLQPEISMKYGESEFVDMPRQIDSTRFIREFKFNQITLRDALRTYKNS